MLSQKEIEYLRSPESFDVDYAYVLKHKIKSKVKDLKEELELLGDAGFLNLRILVRLRNLVRCSKA